MYRFTVTTEATDRLDMATLCHIHANGIWIPDHLDPQQAEEFALDHFRRTVLNDHDMLVVKAERDATDG